MTVIKSRALSLDQVLKCVAVGPLLRVRGPVPDGGEVTQAETVLHALLATRLLLLGALSVKQSDTTRQRWCEQFHTHMTEKKQEINFNNCVSQQCCYIVVIKMFSLASLTVFFSIVVKQSWRETGSPVTIDSMMNVVVDCVIRLQRFIDTIRLQVDD